MEEQKKTWIPACARMTEGKEGTERKKEQKERQKERQERNDLRRAALGRQADPHAFLSVIPDIFNRESRVFVFPSFVKSKTLDSCFRRNDRLRG